MRAFRLNWAAGASPSVGQDYLLHAGVTYEVSQAAAPGARIRDGRVAVGVF